MDNSPAKESLQTSQKQWDTDFFPVLRTSLGVWISIQVIVVGSAVWLFTGFENLTTQRLTMPAFMLLVMLYLLAPVFRNKLKSWYTPVFIAFLTVIPWYVILTLDYFETSGSDFYVFASASRGLPLLFVSLVLMSWYYGFRGAFIYTLVTTAVDIFIRAGLDISLGQDIVAFFASQAQKVGSFLTRRVLKRS